MKGFKKWMAMGMASVMLFAMAGCGKTEETTNTGKEANLRTQLQKNAETFEISFTAPEEILPYLEITPFIQDVSAATVTFVSGENSGNIGHIVLYTTEEYDELKKEEVPLEEELLRDTENGVVLAYGGMQDSVFESGTSEADLVQKYQDEIDQVKRSFQMEKVSDLPEEANMETVLQLGEDRYALSFAVPENLAEYLSFGVFSKEDAAVTVQFEHNGQVGNIGTFVLYSTEEYDALKQENLPLETELLRMEEEGIVLAYGGLQDSVFEPGTVEAHMVLQYQEALGEILKTIHVEKAA